MCVCVSHLGPSDHFQSDQYKLTPRTFASTHTFISKSFQFSTLLFGSHRRQLSTPEAQGLLFHFIAVSPSKVSSYISFLCSWLWVSVFRVLSNYLPCFFWHSFLKRREIFHVSKFFFGGGEREREDVSGIFFRTSAAWRSQLLTGYERQSLHLQQPFRPLRVEGTQNR